MGSMRFKVSGMKKTARLAATLAMVLAGVGAAHAGGGDGIGVPEGGPLHKWTCGYLGPGDFGTSKWNCRNCKVIPILGGTWCSADTLVISYTDPSDP